MKSHYYLLLMFLTANFLCCSCNRYHYFYTKYSRFEIIPIDSSTVACKMYFDLGGNSYLPYFWEEELDDTLFYQPDTALRHFSYVKEFSGSDSNNIKILFPELDRDELNGVSTFLLNGAFFSNDEGGAYKISWNDIPKREDGMALIKVVYSLAEYEIKFKLNKGAQYKIYLHANTNVYYWFQDVKLYKKQCFVNEEKVRRRNFRVGDDVKRLQE